MVIWNAMRGRLSGGPSPRPPTEKKIRKFHLRINVRQRTVSDYFQILGKKKKKKKKISHT